MKINLLHHKVRFSVVTLYKRYFFAFVDSKFFDQLNELAELRDKKRRRAKYVTPAIRKSFYDVNLLFRYS